MAKSTMQQRCERSLLIPWELFASALKLIVINLFLGNCWASCAKLTAYILVVLSSFILNGHVMM